MNRALTAIVSSALLVVAAFGTANAQQSGQDATLIQEVRIFDGRSDQLSGPMISQTSGHSAHRNDSQQSKLLGGEDDTFVRYGHMAIADGVPQVLQATRKALRRGASPIKTAVGGGTGSYADPLDVVEFTPEENLALIMKDGTIYKNTIA